jgi:hypothetical protein
MKFPKLLNLKPSLILLLSVLFFSFNACKKEEKKDEYKVKYTVDCNGRFKSSTPLTITFKNTSGADVTEDLTVNKTWIKEITGSAPFPIKAKINGTIDSASVNLSVEGYKNGTQVETGAHGQSSNLETEITLSYDSFFE